MLPMLTDGAVAVLRASRVGTHRVGTWRLLVPLAASCTALRAPCRPAGPVLRLLSTGNSDTGRCGPLIRAQRGVCGSQPLAGLKDRSQVKPVGLAGLCAAAGRDCTTSRPWRAGDLLGERLCCFVGATG